MAFQQAQIPVVIILRYIRAQLFPDVRKLVRFFTFLFRNRLLIQPFTHWVHTYNFTG